MQCIHLTLILILEHHNVVLINAKIQINVTTEKVWDIISSLDEDPIFWKGTTSVRNLSKNGNVTTREVTL
ncbi:MAG: hypothetical protein ACREAN_00300, partial [Nitrosopumilaceae archaeon]